MYAVYNLMFYFSRQPADIRCCPVCGNSLSESHIGPSKAVVVALSQDSLIPVHDFSRLFRCSKCPWWAVWESWSYRECNSGADFLIVAEGSGGELDYTNQQSPPWSLVLEDEHIYDRTMSLPDDLGQLFVGGERINFPSVQKNIQSTAYRTFWRLPFINFKSKTAKKR